MGDKESEEETNYIYQRKYREFGQVNKDNVIFFASVDYLFVCILFTCPPPPF
jgi:hypothetical protein